MLHPRPCAVTPAAPTGFVAALVGRRIEAVRRRGKYFWLASTTATPSSATSA